MKFQEIIAKYQALSEEQKKALDDVGYYSVTSWEHYWKFSSFSLGINNADWWRFVPFYWVKSQKKYDWKGAKVNSIFYPLFDWKWEDKEFRWFRFGRVVNIKYLKTKDWNEVGIDELKKENMTYEPKETKAEKLDAKKKTIQDIIKN